MKKFPIRKADGSKVVAGSDKKQPATKIVREAKPVREPKTPAPVVKVDVKNTSAVELKKLATIVEAQQKVLNSLQAEIRAALGGQVKPVKTVNNVVTGSKAEAVEQFVLPNAVLKRVFRDNNLSDGRAEFTGLSKKFAADGITRTMFGKQITVNNANLVVYSVSGRGGVCKLVCMNEKGKRVLVPASDVISF